MIARAALIFLAAALLLPQERDEPAPTEFVCPMDPDVRTKGPAKCSRCGMKLVANLPAFVEYPVQLKTKPRAVTAGEPVELQFRVLHPETDKIVRQFEILHEKIFHLFLVSQDLSYFAHEHPELGRDSVFRYRGTLPKPGAYRIVGDFYPTGAMPQLSIKTLVTAGAAPEQLASSARLSPDLEPKKGPNLEVELATEPPRPLAGKETLMFFRVKPSEGLEQYLGAWGHMLAASDDLVDLIHAHPRYADGGPQIQFNVLFPREAVYRVWVQFQRQGTVNTLHFDVPVTAIR